MNLPEERYLPVRRRDGRRHWIAPRRVTKKYKTDPVIAAGDKGSDFAGALCLLRNTPSQIGFTPAPTIRRCRLFQSPLAPDPAQAVRGDVEAPGRIRRQQH